MYNFIKFAFILCAAIAAHSFPLKDTDVVFHLYTRTNPTISQPLLPSIASISLSSFSNSRRTIFTIHSYGENVSGNFNAFAVPAHLEAEDVNVIAVDWSLGSYTHAVGVANAPAAGERVADFINILVRSFGYNANLIRIVGVGVGAHAAGVAGRKVDGTIPHIIALDPTLVGWTENPNRLSTSDATFVEVLHTSAGAYGYDIPLGHLDFYANGGVEQPICGNDYICSHQYSYVYYGESITADYEDRTKFVGTGCATYEEAEQINCSGNRNAIFGGLAQKTSPTGVYVFLTNLTPPFARG